MFRKALYEVFSVKGEQKRYYIRTFTSERFFNLCMGLMKAKNPHRVFEVDDLARRIERD
jgi:hypothetical protein